MTLITGIFISIVLAPALHAFHHCRRLNVTNIVNYDEIEGDWIMAASYPNLDIKCRNIVISKSNNSTYELTDKYRKRCFLRWLPKEKAYYMKENQNSSNIEIEDKSFPYCSSSYTLLDGDFNNYMILYTCYDYIFLTKESYEIWTRKGIKYSHQNLTDHMRIILDQYKIKPEDMTFRRPEDCYG